MSREIGTRRSSYGRQHRRTSSGSDLFRLRGTFVAFFRTPARRRRNASADRGDRRQRALPDRKARSRVAGGARRGSHDTPPRARRRRPVLARARGMVSNRSGSACDRRSEAATGFRQCDLAGIDPLGHARGRVRREARPDFNSCGGRRCRRRRFDLRRSGYLR